MSIWLLRGLGRGVWGFCLRKRKSKWAVRGATLRRRRLVRNTERNEVRTAENVNEPTTGKEMAKWGTSSTKASLGRDWCRVEWWLRIWANDQVDRVRQIYTYTNFNIPTSPRITWGWSRCGRGGMYAGEHGIQSEFPYVTLHSISRVLIIILRRGASPVKRRCESGTGRLTYRDIWRDTYPMRNQWSSSPRRIHSRTSIQ